MTDRPFGFIPPEGEPGRDPQRPDQPTGPPPGFDMGELGQMLTQLGQMLSHASTTSGPVNYDLAKHLAMQRLAPEGAGEPTDDQRSAVRDAVRLAEVWLDPATTLPSGVTGVQAWSPRQWVELTLPTWQRLCDPVAQQFATAWTAALPEEARQAAGPLLAMVGQMGGLAFGSQLGTALAQLGTEVLTSTDVGLPLGPEGVAALLPAAIEKFTEGLDRPASEVMVFLAAREAAHHRLFGHVPWLRARLLATVEEFAKGITVDTAALEELAREMDPGDPRALEEAMSSGVLEPKTSPEQHVALARLETLLALVEGWVDVVTAEAIGERLPGAAALRETLRRRRATGGPAEQTFANLVGLELRPRKLRAAAELWRLLTEQRGVEGRDAVWAHPDLVPTADDLDDPQGFAGRAALSVDDFLAELDAEQRGPTDQPEQRRPEQREQPDQPEQREVRSDKPDKPDEPGEPGEPDGPAQPGDAPKG